MQLLNASAAMRSLTAERVATLLAQLKDKQALKASISEYFQNFDLPLKGFNWNTCMLCTAVYCCHRTSSQLFFLALQAELQDLQCTAPEARAN